MIAAGTSWSDAVGAIAAIVQMLAVVTAGAWAYLKFARGRTFNHRGALEAHADLVFCGGEPALKVSVTFHNMGLSPIAFSEDTRMLYIHAVTRENWPLAANIDWGRHLKVVPIFQSDDVVDGQEAIVEEILVALPREEDVKDMPVAYRVNCRVGRRLTRKTRAAQRDPAVWSSQIVVPVAAATAPTNRG
jgi:hypothetical protein